MENLNLIYCLIKVFPEVVILWLTLTCLKLIKKRYKSENEYSYIFNKFKTPNQDFRGNIDFGDVNNLKLKVK